MSQGIVLESVHQFNLKPFDNSTILGLCSWSQGSTPAVGTRRTSPLSNCLLSHTFPMCPDMVTFNYHESPRKSLLPLYRMHIIRICELFCVTDEDCALKQPVPPVSPQEPMAMRYNYDDITREVGQMHGHWKTERQSVFLLK